MSQTSKETAYLIGCWQCTALLPGISRSGRRWPIRCLLFSRGNGAHWLFCSGDELPFLVVLHVGTATALLLYFWRDWIDLGLGLIRQQTSMRSVDARRLLGLMVVATVPAVIVGFAFEKWLRGLFGSPVIASGFLIANGFLLWSLASRPMRA
jgi:undecaprenyl pyrophosphate phosphatase UppP